jgi:AhpD family alkylhydroperoxidase
MRLTHAGRTYSIPESYTLFVQATRSFPAMLRGELSGALHPHFRERIMLAVTEVNGCAVCSWVHSRMALEQGLSEPEISALLAGDTAQIPPGEAVGIAFAQHYADSRARPTRESWTRLVETYGQPGASAILGATRAMMTANAHGIALSGLIARTQGSPQATSLAYELIMTVIPVLFLPMALAHALTAAALRIPLIHFSSDPSEAQTA